MATKAQREANARYDKENTKQFKVKLNKRTDEDILNQLRRLTTFQGYIKELIRKDMEKHQSGEDAVIVNFLEKRGAINENK